MCYMQDRARVHRAIQQAVKDDDVKAAKAAAEEAARLDIEMKELGEDLANQFSKLVLRQAV